MRIGKVQLVALVIGGAVAGSTLSVTAQEGTKPRGERPHKAAFGPMHHAIRSEAVLPPATEGGAFRTVRTNRGVLSSVDGSTLVIDQEDGKTARVAVQDGTRISRDGERAELSDLAKGDHVFTLEEKAGDAAFTTRGVQAISPARWAEMQERRERCRANPEQCRDQMRKQREPGPRGDEPPAAEPRSDGPPAVRPGRLGGV